MVDGCFLLAGCLVWFFRTVYHNFLCIWAAPTPRTGFLVKFNCCLTTVQLKGGFWVFWLDRWFLLWHFLWTHRCLGRSSRWTWNRGKSWFLFWRLSRKRNLSSTALLPTDGSCWSLMSRHLKAADQCCRGTWSRGWSIEGTSCQGVHSWLLCSRPDNRSGLFES